MDLTGIPFTHWDYRRIGDASLNTASMTLLSRLLAQGQLRRPRAWLARPAPLATLRQTLFIAGSAPLVLPGQPWPCPGLWLVEQEDRKIYAYAATRRPAPGEVGGRVLRGLPLLAPAAPWVTALAAQLAAQTLTSPTARRAGPDRPSALWLLTQVEAALLRAALTDYIAHLDAEVLAALRAEGQATAEVFNGYCGLPPIERRNRLQAAQAYPGFATVLREDWRLRRAVATAAPLTRALARHYQVKPRTIDALRAWSGPPDQASTRLALLKQADALPSEYLPRTAADWPLLHRLATPLADLAAILQQDLTHLLKPLRAGWAMGLADLAVRAGEPLDLDAIGAMMQAVYQYGVRPALAQAPEAQAGGDAREVPRQAPAGFYPLWFGRYGLGRLMGMARHWREGLARYSVARLRTDAASTPTPALSWPAVLTGTYRRGPWRIQELTQQTDLEQEGHRLRHCVGTYAANCLCWGSAIFSVQDRWGRSHSTFEVQLADTGPVLIQHKALANAAPSPGEQALVADFLRLVLAAVPPGTVAAVKAGRERLAALAQDQLERLVLLDGDGAVEGALDAEAAVLLGTIVQPLHPAEARREGLAAYLLRGLAARAAA